jgi:hypothetical protein
VFAIAGIIWCALASPKTTQGKIYVPNNREWAMIVWAGVALAAILVKSDLRVAMGPTLKAIFRWKILVTLTLTASWTIVEVLVGRAWSLWTFHETTDTVFWFVSAALVLWANLTYASEDVHFFMQNLRALVTVTVVLGFFVNLFALPLLAELALLPFELLIIGLSVIAPYQEETAPIKKYVDGILVLIGVLLVAHVAADLTTRWSTLNTAEIVRSLILPMWLTAGLLPMIYALGLCSAYGSAFQNINMESSANARKRRLHKFALIVSFHLRVHEMECFGSRTHFHFDESESFCDLRNTAREFRRTPRVAEKTLSTNCKHAEQISAESPEAPKSRLTYGIVGILGRGMRTVLTSALRQTNGANA